MSKAAVGYTRLSQKSDASIPRQKQHIREYAKEKDFDLQDIYNEGKDESGYDDERDEERTEYLKVKELIMGDEIDAVIVNDRQRLGRDFDERMRFVLDLRSSTVSLHTCKEGQIDLSEPSKVVLESFHAAKDDEGKREEIEKAKEAVKERIEAGYYQGRPPYGLQFDEEKKHLIPDDDFDTVLDVLELREDGATYEKIKEKTNVSSISTISRILDRKELYESKSELYGGESN